MFKVQSDIQDIETIVSWCIPSVFGFKVQSDIQDIRVSTHFRGDDQTWARAAVDQSELIRSDFIRSIDFLRSIRGLALWM